MWITTLTNELLRSSKKGLAESSCRPYLVQPCHSIDQETEIQTVLMKAHSQWHGEFEDVIPAFPMLRCSSNYLSSTERDIIMNTSFVLMLTLTTCPIVRLARNCCLPTSLLKHINCQEIKFCFILYLIETESLSKVVCEVPQLESEICYSLFSFMRC